MQIINNNRTSDQSLVYHWARHLPRLQGAVLFGLSRAEHCMSSPTRYWPLINVRQMTSRVWVPSSHVAEHWNGQIRRVMLLLFFFFNSHTEEKKNTWLQGPANHLPLQSLAETQVLDVSGFLVASQSVWLLPEQWAFRVWIPVPHSSEHCRPHTHTNTQTQRENFYSYR